MTFTARDGAHSAPSFRNSEYAIATFSDGFEFETRNRGIHLVSPRFGRAAAGAKLAMIPGRIAPASCLVPRRAIMRARWTATFRTLMPRSKAIRLFGRPA